MTNPAHRNNSCLIDFKTPINGHSLPERFTFPFYYEPHPLCRIAASELQQELGNAGYDHNFGTFYERKGIIGKMFGVLVVRKNDGTIGYLAAFSGKLPGDHAIPFVPPVFDLQTEGHFFLEGEQILNTANREIEQLENDPERAQIERQIAEHTASFHSETAALKEAIRVAKAGRKIRRDQAAEKMNPEELESFLGILRQESLKEHYFLKDKTRQHKQSLAALQEKLDVFTKPIFHLKEQRKQLSARLQRQLFESYTFLNRGKQTKSLLAIFDAQPPSGAGECAAPKLLQYAFQQGLTPLALAEFWWGRSPGSEIREHGQFYPACKSKCEPILGHMLEGIETDENPLFVYLAEEKNLEIIYEDETIAVIHKPAGFLSVPGIDIEDSVYSRMRLRYPDATGPMIVHRLDMSTSGVMVVTKTKEAHENLQRQFAERTVKKWYVALLDGAPEQENGWIDLPLRVDLDDRPRQLVCFEHGKPARTRWEVAERLEGKTKIRFYPVTGRTHQLRVHAAHLLGLHAPITGDDLYGTKADRLYLHAETLEFLHPKTGEIVQFSVPAEFSA